MGRGPVIYFDCHKAIRDCKLSVQDGVTITESKIFDVDTQLFIPDSGNEFSNIKPFFYTEVVPSLPANIAFMAEERF
jgi:hypothetical protein